MRTLLSGLAFAATLAGPASGQPDTVYTSSNSNLRASPSMSARILAVVPRGARVLAACDSLWCSVTTQAKATGYVSRSLLRDSPPPPLELSDSEVRRLLIRRSIESYAGSCPCPYNRDRAGRACGRRSAYSRPGGAAPLCYESDVTAAMIRRFRERGGGEREIRLFGMLVPREEGRIQCAGGVTDRLLARQSSTRFHGTTRSGQPPH